MTAYIRKGDYSTKRELQAISPGGLRETQMRDTCNLDRSIYSKGVQRSGESAYVLVTIERGVVKRDIHEPKIQVCAGESLKRRPANYGSSYGSQ